MSILESNNERLKREGDPPSAPEWLVLLFFGLALSAAVWGAAVWLVSRLFIW